MKTRLVTVKSAVPEEDTRPALARQLGRAVYVVVIINFLLWVVLLVALDRVLS